MCFLCDFEHQERSGKDRPYFSQSKFLFLNKGVKTVSLLLSASISGHFPIFCSIVMWSKYSLPRLVVGRSIHQFNKYLVNAHYTALCGHCFRCWGHSSELTKHHSLHLNLMSQRLCDVFKISQKVRGWSKGVSLGLWAQSTPLSITLPKKQRTCSQVIVL